MSIRNKICVYSSGGFLLCILVGCLGHIDRTNETTLEKYSKQEIFNKFREKKTTKRDVLSLLGRPNYPHDYNTQNTWLYLSKTEGKVLYGIIPIDFNQSEMLKLEFGKGNTIESMEYKQK